ncbi:MAG TPA: hypothetical protein VGZ33_03410, partial [Acidimicrobiales bacterium]|nr:hypothetical protein [Acidimicrobiales bacterium]
APRVLAGLGTLRVPSSAARAASVSMASADAVVGRLPVAVQAAAAHVSSAAFIDALHAASAVGAVVAVVGAVLAVTFLGSRSTAHAGVPGPATTADPGILVEVTTGGTSATSLESVAHAAATPPS